MLVREVIRLLGALGSVLDCTLGGGGHSEVLLAAGVRRVVALDRDPDAIAFASGRLRPAIDAGRFRPVLGDFTHLDRIAALDGEHFEGVLADLGVSSHQLDRDERGFSFRRGVPLDMRMGPGGRTAAELLAAESEDTLAQVFRDFGDEPRARRLAREIARRRDRTPMETSDDLVAAIRAALGPAAGPADFARLFQAVRIAVNDELAGLERALPDLRDRLEPGGTMAVITYHSGEDRVVKHTFRRWSEACVCPPRQPVCACGGRASGSLVGRHGATASEQEIAINPRARSARLRAWRKAPAEAA